VAILLRVISGTQAGAELPIGTEPQLVGSDERRCDVVLFGSGVAAEHCAVRATGGRGLLLLALDGAVTEINGKPLPPGEHFIEAPAHLRLASADLLLHWTEDLVLHWNKRDAQLAGAMPGRSLRRWAASAACLASVAAFMSGAMGWFERAEPAEIVRARSVAAGMGYRDLAIAYDVEGLLTVTGYVRSAQEAEQVRKAFREFPGKGVVVRVVVAGAATQFDRSARSAVEPQSLGAGSLLIEPPPAASAPAMAGTPDRTLDIQVRALRAGEHGYLETTAGMRYFIGSQLPGGYVLKAVGESSITLWRDNAEFEAPVRR
jgi:hypothetical protein